MNVMYNRKYKLRRQEILSSRYVDHSTKKKKKEEIKKEISQTCLHSLHFVSFFFFLMTKHKKFYMITKN